MCKASQFCNRWTATHLYPGTVASKTEELIEALAAAGVRLDAAVRDERELGDFQFALLDTIALADEQQVAVPTDLLRQVRTLFETKMYFRPESTMRARVDETLKRVEQRSATSAA